MTRSIHKLSATGIEAAIKKGADAMVKKGKAGALNDGGGLTLELDKYGARWLFKFTSPVTSKRREMGFGSLQDVSLAKARLKAQEARELIASRLDPIIERDAATGREAAEAVTFRDMAKDTCALLSKKWTFDSAVDSWNRVVRELGDFSDMAVKAIRGADVAKALSVYDDRPTSKKFALSVIRRTMETAVASELREDNPAMTSRIEKLTSLEHKGGHHPSMPYTDVPAFVKALRAKTTRSARALELCILTGARKEEICGMTLPELDLDNALWTVPEDITKQRREHVVPLVARAVEILREQLARYDASSKGSKRARGANTGQCAYIWGKGNKGKGAPAERLSYNAFTHLLPKGVTTHGFRSSLREFLGDETTVSWNTAEETIGHKVGNATSQAYRRAPGLRKRREALQNWADFIDGNFSTTNNTAENVVEFQNFKEQVA